MTIKRYGFSMPVVSGSYHSNYVEFRMLSLIFGLSLGMLFMQPALMIWGLAMFIVSMVAEEFGRKLLIVGVGLSLAFFVASIIQISSQLTPTIIPALLMLCVTLGLIYEAYHRDRLFAENS